VNEGLGWHGQCCSHSHDVFRTAGRLDGLQGCLGISGWLAGLQAIRISCHDSFVISCLRVWGSTAVLQGHCTFDTLVGIQWVAHCWQEQRVLCAVELDAMMGA
jgi:hypothetical protein